MDGAKLWDSITGIIASHGLSALSSVERVLDAFKERNRLEMKLVPGLFGASSFINNTKLDFVGLVLPKVGLNKNFSSVSIFRNFPFLSGISFLSFWAVLFLFIIVLLEFRRTGKMDLK